MIVNGILTSEDPKNKEKWPAATSKILKHIKEKIQFDIKTSLPKNLEPCVVEQAAPTKSSKSEPAASSSSVKPKKQLAPAPAAATEAKEAEQQKAKFRRFSSKKEAKSK